MEIKDLQARQANVEVVGEITNKEEPREFQKFGRAGRVCTATIKDASGEIKMTLWNDDIEKVKIGDKVHITNGYVNERQGEPQLTTGRFGKMEILGQSDQAKAATEDEMT